MGYLINIQRPGYKTMFYAAVFKMNQWLDGPSPQKKYSHEDGNKIDLIYFNLKIQIN